MAEIKVVGFDGLNRSGKGTQINLLKRYLEAKDISVKVMRGDGSRKGEGIEDDPYSEFWRDIQPHLRRVGPDGRFSRDCWQRASEKLNSELHRAYHFEFPEKVDKTESRKGVIILDRTIISRLFVERQYDSTKELEDLLFFIDEDSSTREVVIPDLAFILHVDKDVLLRRNEGISDHPDKYEFRKRVITEYHGMFEKVSRGIRYDRIRLVHLDGNRATDTVFNDVRLSYERPGEARYV